MHTRNKLREAKYFLDILPNVQDDSDKFDYNLSAFLNAWRSVLDIMLYDFAEHYSIGFTRNDEMSDKEFYAVANVLKKHEAILFVKWWRKKQGMLRNSPLWKKRIISVHRGVLEMFQTVDVYVSSGGNSGTISPYVQSENIPPESTLGSLVPQNAPIIEQGRAIWTFADFPEKDAIEMCKKGYNELEAIVAEAEKEFNVPL